MIFFKRKNPRINHAARNVNSVNSMRDVCLTKPNSNNAIILIFVHVEWWEAHGKKKFKIVHLLKTQVDVFAFQGSMKFTH